MIEGLIYYIFIKIYIKKVNKLAINKSKRGKTKVSITIKFIF